MWSSSGGGLEQALRREGTKVIRLTDPAQITVDRRASSEESAGTYNYPPTLGPGGGDPRIGIALVTPPPENAADSDPVKILAHPYAQGGITYRNYVPAQPFSQEKAKETSVAHLGLHPYAQQTASRDSYISDGKIIPLLRQDSDIPPPAKMWAQWAPGTVHEVLPSEMTYSPFMSEIGDGDDGMDVSSRNSTIILDTVGVGEALAYAVRSKPSKDDILGTMMDQEIGVVVDSSNQVQPQIRSYRQPVQYDATRPLYLSQMKVTGHPLPAVSEASSSTSPSVYNINNIALHTPRLVLPLDLSRCESPSEIAHLRMTSISPETPSPPLSPRPFDNPDSLEPFHDLFYKPPARPPHAHRSSSSRLSELSTSTYGIPLPGSKRRGSGLTTLARKLSEELVALEREEEGGMASLSDSDFGVRRQGTMDSTTLEFVFEEPESAGGDGSISPPSRRSMISPFQPSSEGIPQDVESPIDPGDDETG